MFDALVVVIMGTVTFGIVHSDLPEWFRIVAAALFFVGLFGMTWWVNIAMRRHPREISYGPNELLEESRLEHERKMKSL